jgi:carboxypeptidase Taq
VRPPDDARGVLQDIHWSFGEFGYFPTYAIGNMYSATLLGAAERALPTLWSDAAQGGLLGLREWLRTNIHSHGRAKPAEEIVRDVTGSGLTERDLLAYLARKYEV